MQNRYSEKTVVKTAFAVGVVVLAECVLCRCKLRHETCHISFPLSSLMSCTFLIKSSKKDWGTGRGPVVFRSREYQDKKGQTRTAYELSASKVKLSGGAQ